jgi:hypothetical protein
MTDIMQGWKESRFIIAPSDLVEDDARLVVLTDYNFWSEHISELINWCVINNATTEGMTVAFGDDATLLLFVLRWS